MKLIKLSANKKSFHTVKFHDGLNLIVGKKYNPDDIDLKNTYNGVGKSLFIELIHFCLASDNKELEKKLSDWEFTLEFDIEGVKNKVIRKCSEQDDVIFNGETIKTTKFKEILEENLFYLKEKQKYLTFRSLFSRFVRRGKLNYSNYFHFINNEKPFQKLINTGYLLGLNTELMQKKHDLKKQLDSVNNTKKAIQKDEIIKQYFNNDNKKTKEINIELKYLEGNIKIIETDLKKFKVADNYYGIQEEANKIKNELQNCENSILLLKNDLESINDSLDIKLDVSKDLIFSLYKEVGFELPDKITKKIDEVLSFHNTLTAGRVKRLTDEKIRIQDEVKNKDFDRQKLADKLNNNLKYLGEHNALDDFVVLNEKLSKLKNNFKKLNDYKELLQEYKEKVESLKIEFSQENIRTVKYLNDNKSNIDKNVDLFRSFSKEFYKDKPSGIDIVNNESTNQIRFDINVKIEDDTSDGINEVKIFCFDFTLLLASFNHSLGFIIHDSRLFSNMDPRQRATLFDIANKYSLEYDRQYIATINEDNLQPLLDYYKRDKYKEIIEDNVVLDLTDESPRSKLLGVQIDLEY